MDLLTVFSVSDCLATIGALISKAKRTVSKMINFRMFFKLVLMFTFITKAYHVPEPCRLVWDEWLIKMGSGVGYNMSGCITCRGNSGT